LPQISQIKRIKKSAESAKSARVKKFHADLKMIKADQTDLKKKICTNQLKSAKSA